jgi:hypothetical protein
MAIGICGKKGTHNAPIDQQDGFRSARPELPTEVMKAFE